MPKKTKKTESDEEDIGTSSVSSIEENVISAILPKLIITPACSLLTIASPTLKPLRPISSNILLTITFWEYDNYIQVGAGTMLAQVVNYYVLNGIAGFEQAVGIPGTIGGAVVMNAGAFKAFKAHFI